LSWFSTTLLSFFRIGVEFPHSTEISGIVSGVSADVTTEQRTSYRGAYLTKPLFDQVARAFRER
jgi:hypothetical protein